MPVICNIENCGKPAVLKRPKTEDPLCKECFYFVFETEIHATITKGKLFKRGDKVAVGASGGKDSTVLAYVLKLLNDRYDYGLDLFLLSIDEGITGYRDDSLETVKQNRDDYKLPLKILSYKDLYGWTMDEIVAKIGKKNNCTFCGVFRRQALDRGAALIGADIIVTGHNADDMAETIIMNILRGDLARLSRCTNIITEGEGTIPRCKPLKYAYEKEIVMYAHYKELVYFSTECMYAPNAFRGHTREYIKDLERVRPSCILDIIHSGEIVQVNKSVVFPKRRTCTRCGFVASQEICKACVLLEGLNIGQPKLGVGKSNKAKKTMGLHVPDGSENKSKKKDNNPQIKQDSKRKIKRQNKKQFSCKEKCKPSCSSKDSEKSISDVDLGDSCLLTSDINSDNEENFCYSVSEESKSSKPQQCCDKTTPCCKSMNCSGSSENNLNDDLTNISQGSKELVDYKYLSKFPENTDDKFNQQYPNLSDDYNVEESESSTLEQGFQKADVPSTSVDFSKVLNSELNINDDIANSVEEQEELIECKCPLSFERTTYDKLDGSNSNLNDNHKLDLSNPNLNNDDKLDSSNSNLTNDDKIDYDEVINLNFLAKLFLSDKPDILSLLTQSQNSKNEKPSSSTENEFESLDSLSIEDFFYIYELPLLTEEEDKISSSELINFNIGKKEEEDVDLLEVNDKLSSLTTDDSKNPELNLVNKSSNKNVAQTSTLTEKPSSLETKSLNVQTSKHAESSNAGSDNLVNSLNVQIPKHTESPLKKSLDNLENSEDEQPNIVKATPTRKKPSLILPEMMYKTKNNLEF